MYDFLRGRITRVQPTAIVVDVGGVGWMVETSLRTSAAYRTGTEGTLLVHQRVTEDSARLFGFVDEEERTLFRRLLKVSGVGPAHALALLSGPGPEQIWTALRDADERKLTSSKGIGAKIAQRLITELKEEARRQAPGGSSSSTPAAPGAGDVSADDAASAMIVLGYTEGAAAKAVAAARKKLGADAPTASLIREALKSG